MRIDFFEHLLYAKSEKEERAEIDSFADQISKDPTQYVIHGTKVIDLSKVDVEELKKEEATV